MQELIERITQLESQISNLMRVGTVSSINESNETARVTFSERDNLVSYDLPVMVRNTLKNKDYWMPDVGETVLCCFLPIGMEAGFIIGGFYTDGVTKPATDGNKRVTEYEDGTTIIYDRTSHLLEVNVPASGGQVKVNAETKVTVVAPAIDLGESADLEPSVLGDKLAAWIEGELKPWLDDHVHIGNLGIPTGPAQSSPSGPFDAGTGANGGDVYSTKNRNQ